MDKSFTPETLCVQGGWRPKKGEPGALPTQHSTTFRYATSEQLARWFDFADIADFYAR